MELSTHPQDLEAFVSGVNQFRNMVCFADDTFTTGALRRRIMNVLECTLGASVTTINDTTAASSVLMVPILRFIVAQASCALGGGLFVEGINNLRRKK